MYYSLGQYAESAAELERAIVLSQDAAMQLWNNLALSYAAGGMHSPAEKGIVPLFFMLNYVYVLFHVKVCAHIFLHAYVP